MVGCVIVALNTKIFALSPETVLHPQPLRSPVRKHDQGLLTAWADGIIIEIRACWSF